MLNELNWRSTQKPLIVKSQAISLQISQLHSAVQEFSLHDPSYHHRIDYLLAICDFDGVQRQTRIWARKVWGVGDIGLFNLMSNPSFTLPFFFAFIHLPISIWTCLQAISLRVENVEWSGEFMVEIAIFVDIFKSVCAHIFTHNRLFEMAWLERFLSFARRAWKCIYCFCFCFVFFSFWSVVSSIVELCCRQFETVYGIDAISWIYTPHKSQPCSSQL